MAMMPRNDGLMDRCGQKSEKGTTGAAAQLAESVRRITEVEEEAVLATEKLADPKRQVTRSAETAKDA